MTNQETSGNRSAGRLPLPGPRRKGRQLTTITLTDGRQYAFEEWGDPAGQVLFWLHGTPGGRLTRHPDPTLWSRLGLRVVTGDRPGYGQSAPLPGRLVAHIGADVAAVADHLGVDRFAVLGGSGGGPHALAVAALLGDRIRACVPVCSAAPANEQEQAAMVEVNRESFRIWHEQGRPGIARRLSGLREQILADPLGGMTAQMADAPEADRDWFSRPDVRQITAESLTDALRPGVDGWVDDSVSFIQDEPWGFDLSSISCPTHFWHSDDDANAPLSAVRRVLGEVPDARLTTWHGQGHSAPSRNMEQVLTELVGTLAAVR
jgi:pimeloyl-ACP methyl ester carboxylesterase